MEPVYSSLTDRALELTKKLQNVQQRVLVVLAGPPGSGKTTIADHVVQRLNSTTNATEPLAVVLPMDGFHLPRSTLDVLPNKAEAYARRGANWTFDGLGVLKLVKVLSESRTRTSDTILAPSFDHAAKDSVANGIVISPNIKFVILEGNYLLLNEDPWSQINKLVDDTWFVDVDPDLARNRIAKRHIKAGIESTWEDAVKRAEGNDLLNGVEIRKNLVKPAFLIQSVEE
ncbi:hypothetical protein HYFRA_00013817 [Hymenoscyphus fraxineus]|uniref:Phosphoribulokinase/uridine kinase domain-containing protein n=1 Tax=Hymenoscyphus fraxineus TaxID=746836 RepID=A0A9N9PVH2_9HELO|nr:hypothetical protein HYFRA_00013817 [Hymenoscyphus fraxineus]